MAQKLRGTLTYVIKVPFTDSFFSPSHLLSCLIDYFELVLETVSDCVLGLLWGTNSDPVSCTTLLQPVKEVLAKVDQ